MLICPDRKGQVWAWLWGFAVGMGWTALALLWAFAACAKGAPVPERKLVKKAEKAQGPPPHVGSWRMKWGEGEGDCVFSADGGYWCLWAGQQWLGSWLLEGGRLFITEGKMPDRPDAVPESPVRWSVELEATGTKGVCTHEGRCFPFALKRPGADP